MNRRQCIKALLSTGVLGVAPGYLAARTHYDFYFTRLSYESGNWNVDERMPSNLINSLIEYTTISVDPEERIIPLGDPAMLKSPFCYLSGHKLVQFNTAEKRNFYQYVNNGGFVFVDDCNHDIDGAFAKSFEAQMSELFGEQSLQKIPNDHPIYSAFFKFDGPPLSSVELNGWGDNLVHEYLKAIIVDGKIAVLYSNKDYGCDWDYDFRNKRFMYEDNTKFAVNIVVYAMTA